MVEKYKIVKKAYRINLDRIEEGYLYDEFICHAEKMTQAKSLLIKEVKYEGMELKYRKKDVNYLNIPVVRCKSADIVEFEGENLPIVKIDSIIKQRERFAELDKILSDESVKFCYIKKGGYYYRSNHSGYTEYVVHAGVYTKDDAVSSAKSCGDIKIIPIDIERHNEIINKEIEELKTKLL